MEIELTTKAKNELVDITEQVRKVVKDSGKKEGICLVYSLHSTAGVVINETEPGLTEDFLTLMGRLVPAGGAYKHNLVDTNADAHLKVMLAGQSRTIPVIAGELMLGTWQRVLFFEADGPRSRKIAVVVL